MSEAITKALQDVPVVSDGVKREQINALLNDDSQDSKEMHDFARAILALRPATLSAEFDVRNIMLDVVPGDGSGFEVYAKNVGDVERALAEMDEKLETLEGVQNTRPAVEPMTREQIGDIFERWDNTSGASLSDFVRMVEAHHGITAKAEGGA